MKKIFFFFLLVAGVCNGYSQQLVRASGNVQLVTTANTKIAAIVSTSNFTKSWVDGRLSRIANLTATIPPPTPYANSYFFPVGKTDSLYAPVKFAKINTNITTWTAEYFDGLPFNYTNV